MKKKKKMKIKLCSKLEMEFWILNYSTQQEIPLTLKEPMTTAADDILKFLFF